MAMQIVAKPYRPLPLSFRSRPTVAAPSTSRSLSFTARPLPCSSLIESSSSCAASQSFDGVLLALAASLAVSLSAPSESTMASAATIKMGADEGTLVFVPSSISIPAGEKVIFLNNKGFPHNVIFEKNGAPEAVQVELISHADYMNEQGEQFVVTLKEKGIYRFYCEPHRAAGTLAASSISTDENFPVERGYIEYEFYGGGRIYGSGSYLRWHRMDRARLRAKTYPVILEDDINLLWGFFSQSEDTRR